MNTIQEVIQDALTSGVFAWDLECESTTGDPKDAKNPRTAKVTHVAIASKNTSGCWNNTPEVMAGLCSLLRNPALYALVFNALYDHVVLHVQGHLPHKELVAKVVDVLGLVWLIDEEDEHGLKYSVKKYCGIKMTSFDDVMKNSSAAKKIAAIESKFAAYRKTLTAWRAGKRVARPWPKWSDAPLTRTSVGKLLRTANPTMTAAQAKEACVDLFGDDAQAEYAAWIDSEYAKVAPDIERYRSKIDDHMKVYAKADAENLLKLFKAVMAVIKEERVEHVVKHEMAVRMDTIDMSLEGMRIDVAQIQELATQLHATIDFLEARVYALAEEEFNINSTADVRRILFDKFQVNPPAISVVKTFQGEKHIPAFTPAGDKALAELIKNKDPRVRDLDARNLASIPEELRKFLKCDAVILERIRHELGQAILDYKVAVKLTSTYVDAFLDRIGDGDPIIHAVFNCWGTVTGRLSSKGPNLQNIPSRSKANSYHPDIRSKGKLIRKAFVAPPGYTMLVTDHSQIELRIIADFAGEPGLISVYQEGIIVNGTKFYVGDIHSRTAKAVGTTRSNAKGINFGFNYGMGAEKYARQNRLFKPETKEYDIDSAAKFREGFFAEYSNIPKLMDELAKYYRSGKVSYATIAKRYRHFYDAERGRAKAPSKGTILNSLVQGSAADLLKYIIYIIRTHLYPKFPGMQLIGQVHDELIYIIPNQYAQEAGLLIKYVMEYPWYPLKVPVLASAKLCSSWGAKDDDEIPEIGVYYARVDGEDRLFTAENWHEFLALDAADRVELTSSCAQLTNEQIEWCRTQVPAEMPPRRRDKANRVILTRTQMMAQGLL